MTTGTLGRRPIAPTGAVPPAPSPLSSDMLRRIDAYRRAADYLSVGQHGPFFVAGDDPMVVHRQPAATLDTVLARSEDIRHAAATARYRAMMERYKLHVAEEGDDLPEVRDWRRHL